MVNITAQQKERLIKLAKSHKSTGVFELIEELERQIREIELLKGDQGDRGEKGEQGERGEKGERGEPGKDGKDGRDGKDGKDGRDGIDGKDGKDGIDGKDGEPGTYINLNELWDKIEEKIRDKQFEELDALRKEFSEQLSKIPRGKLGMRKIPIVKSVDLTSQVDGATVAFTLPNDTVKVLGVWGTQFPITFRQDVDWAFSGRTLTLQTDQLGTPQAGQTLWALIETLFYG